MFAPGTTVGNYIVRSPLGEGGMGLVFVAEHAALGKQVALKVLKPELGHNADAVARFITEARAVSRIGHEHIVDVTDFGTDDAGRTFFVMELLSGETLRDRIAREKMLPLDMVVTIVSQIADALQACHAQGIVHRDLKPDNIFLIRRRGESHYVKVLDFGVAKLLGPEGPEVHRTRSGALIGTPYYMSPEQSFGSRDIDHRTDIYSLAVMCYEMLTGSVPFHAEGWGGVLQMHMSAPFPSVRARRPDLPAAFEAVLARAVTKKPQDRYATMAQFRAALMGQPDAQSLAFARTADGNAAPLPYQPTVPQAAQAALAAPPLVAATTTLSGSATQMVSTGSSGKPKRALRIAALGAAALLGLGVSVIYFRTPPVNPTPAAAPPKMMTPAVPEVLPVAVPPVPAVPLPPPTAAEPTTPPVPPPVPPPAATEKPEVVTRKPGTKAKAKRPAAKTRQKQVDPAPVLRGADDVKDD